jgi:hypothetical protein
MLWIDCWHEFVVSSFAFKFSSSLSNTKYFIAYEQGVENDMLVICGIYYQAHAFEVSLSAMQENDRRI